MESSHFLQKWFTMQFNHCFKYHKFWLIVLKYLMMVGIGMLFYIQYLFHVSLSWLIVLKHLHWYWCIGTWVCIIMDCWICHMWIHSFFQLCSKIKALSPFHSKSSHVVRIHHSCSFWLPTLFFVAKFYNILFCSRMNRMLELEDSLFRKIWIA